MMLKIYQIDAFSSAIFGGNPAAVVPLGTWLDDETLQAVATENSLSETAYIVPLDDAYELRWFTPSAEIDLCGHATLATAYVVFRYLQQQWQEVRFQTRVSGTLTVTREGAMLAMDFPALAADPCNPPEAVAEGLGAEPDAVYAGQDYLAVFPSVADVLAIDPDYTVLSSLERRGVIVTAPGDEGSGADFVSRFFCPKYGVPEDPVCGSAHCMLTPYWAGVTGKTDLMGHQVSARGGVLHCKLNGDRVQLKGEAVQYLEGQIRI